MDKKNFRYDSRYDSKNKGKIQEVVEFILDHKKYGDTITYEEVANIFKINIEIEEDFKKLKSSMGRVKNFLIGKGRILKGVSGIGYYILKPKQVSNYCYRTYIRRTMDLLDKSQLILEHTDTTELSVDRKQEYDSVVELNQKVNDCVWNTINTSGYYDRKTYYDSLQD